jgi:threonine aldolase
MNFASDNTGPTHPKIAEAVMKAGEGYAMPYGDDPLAATVRDRIREIFEAPEAEVFLVSTGTAANSLALSAIVQPWQTTYCSRVAHIQEDECGAPEFFSGGAKLTLVPETHARMTPEDLSATIEGGLTRGLHFAQPGALSLTQVTERGTVYSLAALSALCETARRFGLRTHMDGARFANACVALGCTPADMSWRAGIDILSFGGTKNGCMGVEAIVVFDPSLARELLFRRKRSGHLFSKHRFLSAQMAAYLEEGLWLDLATRANRAAARLVAGLKAAGADMLHPTDANMIYTAYPARAHRRAVAGGAQYFMTLDDLEGHAANAPITTRLVTNWASTDEEIDHFLSLIAD